MRNRKRVGRGHGSGRGTYAGRGLKGQRSRTGGRRNLKRRGLKQFLLQIPKQRGFQSFFPVSAVVNIGAIDKGFQAGSVVTIKRLKELGLINDEQQAVKILGEGQLKKKLTVQANAFSKKAKDAITKAGGIAQVVK